MCSFIVAPSVGDVVRDDLGDFEVKKTLSVKVPINKEDFGIVGRFLVG